MKYLPMVYMGVLVGCLRAVFSFSKIALFSRVTLPVTSDLKFNLLPFGVGDFGAPEIIKQLERKI